MERIEIKNRKNQTIIINLELVKNQKGIAFVMHGLGGNKDQSHMRAFSDAFLESNYSVIRFDTTNTFGESDGNYENATTTNYFEDLEDVIKWAKTQKWYQEPFCLVGHSLGGISTILYAEKYPEKVKALAPISTVVSGKISLESPQYKDNDVLKKWEETGWRISESSTTPGLIKKLKWSHIIDRLKYDTLDNINKLTMPVLLIVGDKDESTPPEHQKILFDKLPEPKELHIIKNAPHSFRDPKHLNEIKTILKDWIKKIS